MDITNHSLQCFLVLRPFCVGIYFDTCLCTVRCRSTSPPAQKSTQHGRVFRVLCFVRIVLSVGLYGHRRLAGDGYRLKSDGGTWCTVFNLSNGHPTAHQNKWFPADCPGRNIVLCNNVNCIN